jgi:uncharacterized membrane protein SpoIIM required for sporulation
MPPRVTDLNQFLNRRHDGWRRLEVLLERVEAAGLDRLSPAEVREFGTLYRRASSDLVTARSKTANAEVLQYLNDLVARAYAQVYRTRRFHLKDIVTFLWIDFPRLFRHTWKYMALSAVIMLAAVAFGWEMNRRDPAGAYYMLPDQFVKQIPAMRQHWQGVTGHELDPYKMVLDSTHLMTHNIGIGAVSFAGGIFFGVPTLWALFLNGALLGVLGQAMSTKETGLVFWSLILPHGFIELSAIAIFGGAGFIIASGLLAPGRRSRKDALLERGRMAILLVVGASVMLVIAGLIEGIITPPAQIPPLVKILFAFMTQGAEIAYFGFAGRGPQPGLLKQMLKYEETPEKLPTL